MLYFDNGVLQGPNLKKIISFEKAQYLNFNHYALYCHQAIVIQGPAKI